MTFFHQNDKCINKECGLQPQKYISPLEFKFFEFLF